jgi:ABC-type transport system involved in multi-copper enzyme maturation permease subunit
MMNWLLWKEYRHNRVVVYATLLFILVPHLLALYACCRKCVLGNCEPKLWREAFGVSSFYSFLLSQLIISVVAGNAFAGERVDRSAEFLMSLPISRSRILVSKLLFSLAIIAVIWLTNATVILCLTGPPAEWGSTSWSEILEILGGIAIVTSAFFCVAWFLSSFLSSPTFAVAGGLLTPLLLLTGIVFVGYLLDVESLPQFDMFFAFAFFGTLLVLGPICFGVGTWYYLRRVEP